MNLYPDSFFRAFFFNNLSIDSSFAFFVAELISSLAFFNGYS